MAKERRTRSEVLALRERAVYGGCCDRFADNQACDCLENAVPDSTSLCLTSGMNLRERLADWTEVDIACYELGVCLGLWPDYRVEGGGVWDSCPKAALWTRNPVCDFLAVSLERMVEMGVLERNEGGDRYRANPVYQMRQSCGWEER